MDTDLEEICKKVIFLGKENQRTLCYYVTTGEIQHPDKEGAIKTYGVGISIEEKEEFASVNSITTKKETAYKLIDILASNFVTPVSLYDVIYDWLP